MASKNETLYRVTIKKLDGTETTNYVPAGTKIVLNDSKDEFYQFDLTLYYDDDSEHLKFTSNHMNRCYLSAEQAANSFSSSCPYAVVEKVDTYNDAVFVKFRFK